MAVGEAGDKGLLSGVSSAFSFNSFHRSDGQNQKEKYRHHIAVGKLHSFTVPKVHSEDGGKLGDEGV